MARPRDGEVRVSRRQAEILALIAAGLADKEIASRLGVSHGTVRTHLKRLFRTHRWHNRTEAVAAWMGLRRFPPAAS